MTESELLTSHNSGTSLVSDSGDLVDLEKLSSRLQVKPATLKRRVHALGIQVLRGSRGKLLFEAQAQKVLEEVNALMLEGDGLNTVRRKLALHDQDETQKSPESDQVNCAAPVNEQHHDQEANESLTLALRLLQESQAQLAQAQADARRQAEVAAAMSERVANLSVQLAQASDRILLLEAPRRPKGFLAWLGISKK